ncbi:MAG: dephospho-CoA kinase [Paracoccaceae bacterium]
MTRRPYRLGLTGSIGMGKSTTAALFANEGIPVWDADAAVHRLYAAGGAGAQALSADFPEAIVNGAVDRASLKDLIARDPSALQRIERLIHPLVAADRAQFLEAARSPLVVLDVPLLYETGAESGMDGVLVVTAPPDIQRQRVLSRTGMTETQFESLLSRQMPDAEKRARADFIIETTSLEVTRGAVRALIKELGKSDA